MSRTIGLLLLVLVMLGVCAPSVNAQISSVRIYAKPAGPGFYVDEQWYTSEVTLLWPAGSKHFIRTDPVQNYMKFKTQYTFGAAITNLGPPVSISPISADPGLTYIELDFSTSYAVDLSYFPCAPTDAACLQHSPGTVYMNGAAYRSDTEQYYAAGSTVSLQAYPASGYIFTGWGLMEGVPKGTTFIWSFPLNQPQSVHPLFQTAQPIQINIGSTPPGMQLLVDRTPVYGTTNYQWGWGTDHEIGAIQVQRDTNGHEMIFSSWSDGGMINHVYHVTGGASEVLNVTANFVPGANVSFLTNPPLLKLAIDGRTNWQNYTFDWAQGTTHTVSAPATQTDALGHTYRFSSWSNGAAATQQFTVSSLDDTRITANYIPVGLVTVNSAPVGLNIQLDGSACTTPCTVQRDVGTQVSVSVPGMFPAGDGSRLMFQGWADSSANNRTVTTAASETVLTANFQMQYQLSTGADPATGVVWSVAPTTNDGYYNAMSTVSISAAPNPGYRFLNWSGDAAGNYQPLAVKMSAPKNITAILDPVPFVADNGVKNAAGDTPEAIVAPGSVISIMGVNLAPWQEQGPATPLKQTLAGVTAHVAGLLMPLFFVSPSQINAQLPFEVTPGPQTLTLKVPGKPDVNVDFTVARNAPGLFTSPVGDTPYVMASHADGSPVTPDSPAAQGETVTLYATGLGPYGGNAPDGFALPQGPDWVLVDPVDLVVGDLHLSPAYTGTAAQKVGVNAITFIVTSDLPTGTNVPVKVTINGHDSNVAILPLK